MFFVSQDTNPQGEFVQLAFLSVIELKFDIQSEGFSIQTVPFVQRAAVCANPSPHSGAEYGVGWRRAVKTLQPEQRFHLFQCGVYNVCGLFQEEDVDEDTLTTDTLSPDASHSSNSCSTQVSAATPPGSTCPEPNPAFCATFPTFLTFHHAPVTCACRWRLSCRRCSSSGRS